MEHLYLKNDFHYTKKWLKIISCSPIFRYTKMKRKVFRIEKIDGDYTFQRYYSIDLASFFYKLCKAFDGLNFVHIVNLVSPPDYKHNLKNFCGSFRWQRQQCLHITKIDWLWLSTNYFSQKNSKALWQQPIKVLL